MRSFSKVSPNVWQSQRFNALPDDSRLLYFYLLTSPHANSAGPTAYPAGTYAQTCGGSQTATCKPLTSSSMRT